MVDSPDFATIFPGFAAPVKRFAAARMVPKDGKILAIFQVPKNPPGASAGSVRESLSNPQIQLKEKNPVNSAVDMVNIYYHLQGFFFTSLVFFFFPDFFPQ